MPGSQPWSQISIRPALRTHVRMLAVRRRSYLTNTCSPPHQRPSLRSARSVLYVWPARSCCSRTTTRSTGRSARTSAPTYRIRTGRRCAEGAPSVAPASCRRDRRRVFRRSVVISTPRMRLVSGVPTYRCGRQGTPMRVALAVVFISIAESYAASGWRNDDGPPEGGPCIEKTGGVLLSQALAGQVPSALRGLTALFGMGRGVSPSPRPPEKGERPRPHGPSKLHSCHSG